MLYAPKPSLSLKADEEQLIESEEDDDLEEPSEMETSVPEYTDTVLGLTLIFLDGLSDHRIGL